MSDKISFTWAQFQGNKRIGDLRASYIAPKCVELWGSDPHFIGCNFREFILRDVTDVKSYITQLVQALIPVFGEGEDWIQWLPKQFVFGTGSSPLKAYLAMRLGEFRLTYSSWKNRALTLRRQLQTLAQSYHVPWEELLRASRRYGRNITYMTAWLNKYHCPKETGTIISDYGYLLTMADFVDPREYQLMGRGGFFEETEDCEKLLVSDVTDAGVIKRINQDEWLEQGALKDQIYAVYQKDTLMIQTIRRKIVNSLRYIPRLCIPIYTDLVVGLINQLPESILTAILNELARIPQIHYTITDYLGSFRQTCARALEELKAQSDLADRKQLGLA